MLADRPMTVRMVRHLNLKVGPHLGLSALHSQSVAQIESFMLPHPPTPPTPRTPRHPTSQTRCSWECLWVVCWGVARRDWALLLEGQVHLQVPWVMSRLSCQDCTHMHTLGMVMFQIWKVCGTYESSKSGWLLTASNFGWNFTHLPIVEDKSFHSWRTVQFSL